MCHGRAPRLAAQAPRAIKNTGGHGRGPRALAASAGTGSRDQGRSADVSARRRAVLGAPGGSRSAHVIQLRPVRIESLGEELATEGAEFGEGARPSVAAASRGGKGA